MADDRMRAFRRYLAIWNGEAESAALDGLVTSAYLGHLGSRDRDLAELKRDIADHRKATPTVQFIIEHQFGDGDFVASRVRAQGSDSAGKPITASGMNISRWDGTLLAEEWAIWEPFH